MTKRCVSLRTSQQGKYTHCNDSALEHAEQHENEGKRRTMLTVHQTKLSTCSCSSRRRTPLVIADIACLWRTDKTNEHAARRCCPIPRAGRRHDAGIPFRPSLGRHSSCLVECAANCGLSNHVRSVAKTGRNLCRKHGHSWALISSQRIRMRARA